MLGIFDLRDEDWYNANLVFVPYCSSDAHMGDSDHQVYNYKTKFGQNFIKMPSFKSSRSMWIIFVQYTFPFLALCINQNLYFLNQFNLGVSRILIYSIVHTLFFRKMKCLRELNEH